MKDISKERALTAAVFSGVLAADWTLLSKAYVFEGLARAMPIDVGLWRELTPGHYLLYGPLGWAFHHALALWLGISQPAVVSLQLLDGLLGAAGAALQFSTLRRLGASRPAAAAWACALAACMGWWVWSTDAQTYILSAALLALAFRFVIERAAGGKVAPWTLGLLHALALTGHAVNALFAVPIVLILWKTEPKKTRGLALASYAAAFAAAGAAAYGLALALCVRPANTGQVLHWLAGSANVGATGAVAWHGDLSGGALLAWLGATLAIFSNVGPAQALVAAMAYIGAPRLRALAGSRRLTALACAAWLGAYALVFTSWEPQTTVYRVPDLVPLTTLLWLAFPSAPWGAALAASLFAANLTGELLPRAKPENNAALQRMMLVKELTKEGDWVTGDGGSDELYLPYFAERKPLVLGRWAAEPAALARRLDAIQGAGERVFVTSRALADETWGPFFRSRKMERVGERDGFTVYFLAPRR